MHRILFFDCPFKRRIWVYLGKSKAIETHAIDE
jgi:hypothetical protein